MINVDGAAETKYHYFHDALGSIVALLNNNGSLIEGYSYDSFGKTKINTAAGADSKWLTSDDSVGSVSSVANSFMFTGRQFDAESGLYYYRARYYSPDLGRFLSPDPIGYADSVNLYQYCLNNPVNYTDPLGLLQRGILHPMHGLVSNSIKNSLNEALNPGKPGPGENLKKGDTAKAGDMIADEMTNKELDKLSNMKDEGQKQSEVDKIRQRIEDKLKGGKGDPKAEAEREKGDQGYAPMEGDKEIADRINDAMKKKKKE